MLLLKVRGSQTLQVRVIASLKSAFIGLEEEGNYVLLHWCRVEA